MFLTGSAAASATPQFSINGALAGAAKQNVVQYGTLALDSTFLGEWKCRVIAGGPVWNEAGNGFASVEAWRPYDCSAPSCPGPAYVRTEEGPEPIEESTEKYRPLRRPSTLPWPAETVAPEAGVSRLKIRKIKFFLQCPAEAVEVGFSGGPLEPLIVNGTKNGLSPSRVVFEGKGGKTGSLPGIGVGSDEVELFLSGELATLGMGQELVTAR
jgi:hypothetical protein